jgi:hypothetical protein
MPFAFIIIGLVLLIAGVRNTASQLTTLVKGDVTGQGSFVPWIVSILLIGALGYIKPIAPVSRMFLFLVIAVLILKDGNPSSNSNGGLFSAFNSQLFSPSTTASSPITT